MKMFWMAGLGLPLSLLMAPPVLAQDAEQGPPDDNGDTVTVGLGVAYGPSYEGSDDYRVIPGGVLRGKVSGFSFFTRGPQLYVDVVPEGPDSNVDLSLGPIIGARFNRTGGIKDPQVRALGKLDTAIEVGGFAGIAKTGVITSAYDTLGVRVSYLRDVSDTHDSYIITPAIEYGTPLSTTTYVGISASADYVGNGYARTYFGVTPTGAAASGLAAYDLDKGWKSFNANLLLGKSLSGDLRKGWSIFALGSYSRLLGDFKRSPIVSDAGDANQWFGAIGVGYTF